MTLFLDQAVEVNFVFRSIYRQSSDMVEAINLLEVHSDVRDIKNAPALVIKNERYDSVMLTSHIMKKGSQY